MSKANDERSNYISQSVGTLPKGLKSKIAIKK